MAKLSVYNTIDRSQLGGKFVPLIQSGVSNYKILASDLGKEYHPGDAIEITDTGEINVKFHPYDFDVSSEGLTVKTDADRGVFKGSDGVYIASANDSIGISRDGIKVNTSVLAGYGLESKYNNTLYVKSADSTISVNGDGISVYYGSGLRLDDQGRLSLHNDYLSQYATVRAGHGLYWYHPGYPESALYVQSANNSILVGESGLSVHAYALIDKTYLSITQRHVITVDTASVARAITGSGLVTTNGAIGVNVNTATGIIVNDNKLYLNAGNGLQTTNNAVSVKSANDSIGVSSSGVKVNVKNGGGVVIGSEGLYIDSGALSVGEGLATKSGKLTVNLGTGGGIMFGPGGGALWVNPDDIAGYGLLGYSGTLYVKSADSSIDVHQLGIRVNVGSGLWLHEGGLCVRSADSSIDLSGGGISVNTSSLSHSLPGKGLYSDGNKLSVYIGSGLRFSSTGAIESTSPSAGPGLMEHTNGYLQVKSSDGSIYVDNSGISVDLRNAEYIGSGLSTSSGKLAVKSADSSIGVSENGIRVNAGYGLETTSSGLYVKSADNTIGVGGNGIKVNPSALAGAGLSTDAGKLYVKSADGTIGVTSSGIGVNVTNGGGILTGADGLYIDSGKIAGSGLMASSIEQHNVKLNVKSADNTIDVSSVGIKVNPSAITGSGLVTTNGAIGVNVNTATGIIVKDNKLYLNAGIGFHTTNKTLNLKFDDTSILGAGDSGIYLQYGYGFSADSNFCGLTLKGLGSNHTNLDLTAFSASNGYIYANTYKMAGSGLVASKNSNEFRAHTLLNVKSADNTIGVTDAGVKVNTGSVAAAILGHGLEYNSGKLNVYYGSGLAIDAESGKLYVTSDASKVGKGLYIPSGSSRISVYAGSGLMFDTTNRVSVYAGSGLTLVGPEGEGPLQVKAGSKNTISVLDDGIEVNAGPGLCYAGSLYIQSADNSINVTTDSITVNYGDGLFMNSASKLAVNVGYGLGIDENGGLARLISHSIDGTNWYKKYQDGWIEQGGYFSSNSQAATVTLNTAFANTNYTLMVTCRTEGSATNYNPAVTKKTTTSFTYNSMIAKAFGAEYYACGY